MDPFPDSEPEGPPSPNPPPSTPPPIGSPRQSNSSAPPPSSPSHPPGAKTSPPPATTLSPPSPHPSPPPSPPPDSPPPSEESPPPPPSKKRSPPKRPPPPPPSESEESPQPESSPPPSAAVASPPPQTGTPSPPRANPPRAPAPSAPTYSPQSDPPSPTTAAPPPPVNSTSLPVPPNYNSSPPANSSVPSGSTPTPTSSSGTPNSNTSANSVPPKPNQSEHDHIVRTGIAIFGVAALIIIGFMVVVLLLQRRRKRPNRYNSVYMVPSPYTSSPASGSSFMKQNSNGGENVNSSPEAGGLGWFSFEELTKATNGFASQNILGTGGFGCVYKGSLQDGREVAVKKLKDNSGQGDREFQAEVEIITRVHHRHLVSLVGCCISDHQKLLVYEYVPNNTLHHHLHASNKPVMQWALRVKVACGSARGIAYLHEDCSPRIIHRDIKSANILLDKNFEAKVADFGLAKLAQELESRSHVSTRVMGTFGYMAPEYASSGKLTEKSDVFSFGVVLLELITGRKPVDETRPLGDESLVEWARPLMSEALESQNVDELADPRLEGSYDRGEMFRMIEAAAACVRQSATKRPKMTQVVREFNSMSELSDLTNGMRPGQSGIYDSREQSAQIRMFEKMTFGSQECSPDYSQDSQGSWMSRGRNNQF